MKINPFIIEITNYIVEYGDAGDLLYVDFNYDDDTYVIGFIDVDETKKFVEVYDYLYDRGSLVKFVGDPRNEKYENVDITEANLKELSDYILRKLPSFVTEDIKARL
ncbi:hypothetical protein ACFQZE_15565 [Paenibacillus sp. GCM10027627]|uniref:hypothetical protein n=1 Tax=unclassified Paenibacillus TaxID=185978 RepID=UPI0036316753